MGGIKIHFDASDIGLTVCNTYYTFSWLLLFLRFGFNDTKQTQTMILVHALSQNTGGPCASIQFSSLSIICKIWPVWYYKSHMVMVFSLEFHVCTSAIFCRVSSGLGWKCYCSHFHMAQSPFEVKYAEVEIVYKSCFLQKKRLFERIVSWHFHLLINLLFCVFSLCPLAIPL